MVRASRAAMGTSRDLGERWLAGVARQVFENLALHFLDFGAITARHARKELHRSGDPHLRQQVLEVGDPRPRAFEFVIIGNHGITSTIPRRVKSRLVPQPKRKSSSDPRMSTPEHSQKMLAPTSACARSWSNSAR